MQPTPFDFAASQTRNEDLVDLRFRIRGSEWGLQDIAFSMADKCVYVDFHVESLCQKEMSHSSG